jgi:ABC-2 type transport system ATP-binding protein
VSDLVIDTRGLRKWFGPTLAVADLSLSVRAGEIFGFLGPNGAGKTTSIKMLLSLVHPDGGEGRVLGQPLGDRLARANVGFLPEHFRFHDCLTARELLRFHGRLYGLSGSALDMRFIDCWRGSICSRRPTGRCVVTARACCSEPGWRKRS